MEHSPKKNAILLSVLFAVVYALHGMSGPLSAIYLTTATGEFVSHGFLGWYHILTSVLAAFFYLPLAVHIRTLAKQADMKILKNLSTFVIVALSAFTILNPIAIIVTLIFG